MQVLAVDDDPTCLKILEAMLRKCQYNVTTTRNAMTALQLLRGSKNKFDLVITDIHMPEMDGFKLLELVRIEMDIPVILLSYNHDPKMLKPVRVEQLKTIWHHVMRKKIGSKEGPKTNSNQDTLNSESDNGQGSAETTNSDQNGEAYQKRKYSNQDTLNSDSDNGQGSAETTHSDQNGKASKKRKYHKEDFDDKEHENGNDSEDPSAQKKPRVVWSSELHRKFEAAVIQLGIDKAVPKKILKMMNVENLTKENVASHLQKYRLHLKKISCVENQQANPRLGSLCGSWQFGKNALGSFTPDGMITTPASLNIVPSSQTVEVDHTQNLNNASNNAFMWEEDQEGVFTSFAPLISDGLPSSETLEVDHTQNLNNASNNAFMWEEDQEGVFTSFAPLLDIDTFSDVWSSFC